MVTLVERVGDGLAEAVEGISYVESDWAWLKGYTVEVGTIPISFLLASPPHSCSIETDVLV